MFVCFGLQPTARCRLDEGKISIRIGETPTSHLERLFWWKWTLKYDVLKANLSVLSLYLMEHDGESVYLYFHTSTSFILTVDLSLHIQLFPLTSTPSVPGETHTFLKKIANGRYSFLSETAVFCTRLESFRKHTKKEEPEGLVMQTVPISQRLRFRFI